MPETVSTCSASSKRSSGTLWQGTGPTVPMAAGPSSTEVVKVGFCMWHVSSCLCHWDAWWDLETAIFGGVRMLSVVEAGCFDSTITSSLARPLCWLWLGHGSNLLFFPGSLGCHKIPQERAVTLQNIQVLASISPSDDHFCSVRSRLPPTPASPEVLYPGDAPSEEDTGVTTHHPQPGSPRHPKRTGSRGKSAGSCVPMCPRLSCRVGKGPCAPSPCCVLTVVASLAQEHEPDCSHGEQL